jgi:hypothetical protein
MIPNTTPYLKSVATTLELQRQLASWSPLWLLGGVYVAIVVALVAFGRGRFVERTPDGLQRLTGIPGWAAAAVGTTIYGGLVCSVGLNNDVAWHIALGRDKNLFTAPHTMLIVGLLTITGAALLGIAFATVAKVETGVRIGRLRVPWSMLPLIALAGASLVGFPLDALWHERYGIDVTLWSPTHLLMVLGGSFTVPAAWLVLAEAGVTPKDGRWARGTHLLVAWLTLTSLSGVWTEFSTGVPQFQQLYFPVLICIGAGLGLVAIRLVLGPWSALGIAAFNLAFIPLHLGGGGGVAARNGAIFVGSALVVELVAWRLGTVPRARFAVVSGLGIGTFGLALEFWWNQGARQPWHTSLLPAALVLGVIAAVGASIIGAAFGSAVAREPGMAPRRAAMLVAAALVLVALVVPFPRRVGNVVATVHLERVGATEDALVRVRLEPADAARHARWFQTMNWQSGRLVLAEMQRVGVGEYVSARSLPVFGTGKTTLRLHRGDQVMAVALHLPADPEIGAPEIPAVDRSAPFVNEQAFMLREAHPGPVLFSRVVYGLLLLAAGVCVAAFVIAGRRTRQPSARYALAP